MNKFTFPIIINYINLISALCLILGFMYSDFTFDRIVLIVFFGSYIIEIFTDKKIQNFKFDKKAIYFSVMLFFFLLTFIYLLFENSSEYTQLLIEKRLSLFVFGIVGLLGFNHLFKLKYFLYAFIFTSLITIIYVILRVHISDFILQSNRAELFTAMRVKYVNGHMIFDFYLNLALLSGWGLLKMNWNKLSFWYHGFLIAILIFILAILSHTEGRSGFTAGVLLFISLISYEIIRRKKAIVYAVLLIVPLISIYIIKSHNRMSTNELKGEPRIFLWHSGFNVFINNPVFGLGVSDAQVAFDVERVKNQDDAIKSYTSNFRHVDCHNQYIQTLMEFGIFGLIILLFLYIFPAFIVDQSNRIFAVFALALCAYQSVFDMFATGSFSFIFAFLMVLILRSYGEIIGLESQKS